MTSAAALKSASFALKAFLESKPVGYSFTVDSLREDFMTDPTTTLQLSRGAVSGFVSKAYSRKAFTRARVGTGHIRKYALVDASLIFVKNRRSIGKAPGTHPAKPFKQMPDSDAPMPQPEPAVKPSLPGLGGGQGGASMKGAPPKLHVPADISKRLTRDTMLGAIREIVDAHLAAFEANRPAIGIEEFLAKHDHDMILNYFSTDELLAEIKSRTNGT